MPTFSKVSLKCGMHYKDCLKLVLGYNHVTSDSTLRIIKMQIDVLGDRKSNSGTHYREALKATLIQVYMY